MGLLDFFGRTPSVKKHAARAGNKRAQDPDRQSSIHTLVKVAGNEKLGADLRREAVDGLIGRFSFRVDPSITDQQEKDTAMGGILSAGPIAVAPLERWLKSAESIAWPVKMLQKLLTEEELVGALLGLSESMETEYERDPQKIDVLAQLESFRDARIAPAIVRFLEDTSETVRFHAACTLLFQDDAHAHLDALLRAVIAEEGVRVRVQILGACAARGWELGARAEEVRPKLPDGYALDGLVVRKKK